MISKPQPEGPPDRTLFYLALGVALPLTVCLLWMIWRAMSVANPWFSGIGIAGAAVYVVVIIYRRRGKLPPRWFSAAGVMTKSRRNHRKPALRLVKK